MSIVTARMVKAPVFLAWWKALIELDNELTETLSDEAWVGRGRKVRELITALDDVGRSAGATMMYTGKTADGTIEMGSTLNPDFDWVGTEIDFAARPYEWIEGPRGAYLIECIERVTGISAESVVAADSRPPTQIGFVYPDRKRR